MGFSAAAGRIYITDPADSSHVVLDTDERLFIATDYVAGTISTSSHVASSSFGSRSEINIDADTTIGSINAAADTVFGAFRVTPAASNPFDLASAGWFQATGTYIYARGVINATGNTTGGVPNTPWVSASGHAAFTFRAAGGLLIFNERVFLRSTLGLGATVLTSTIPAADIDFKLYCGSFV